LVKIKLQLFSPSKSTDHLKFSQGPQRVLGSPVKNGCSRATLPSKGKLAEYMIPVQHHAPATELESCGLSKRRWFGHVTANFCETLLHHHSVASLLDTMGGGLTDKFK